MEENSKLNGVYRYIDDIIVQTENGEKYMDESFKHYIKLIDDNFTPYFRAFLGIMSAWGVIVIPIQLFDFRLSLILFGFFGVVILILYLLKKHLISRIYDVIDHRKFMYVTKRKCFLNIRKEMNFYQHSRVDIFLKQEDLFSDKVNRTTMWALYNLDLAYTRFNLNYYKLLYKISKNNKQKLECINNYFKIHSTLLDTILLLNEYMSKPLPFFIGDEIHSLVQNHLEYIPEYYMQPDAHIEPLFDISLSDLIQLSFGGLRQMYKDAGYLQANLILKNMFRKRFFIDKNLNVLKIS